MPTGTVEVLEIMPPATANATRDVRVGGSSPGEAVPVWDFAPDATEYLDYKCLLRNYEGGGLIITLPWTATSATSGGVAIEVAIRRMADDADDLDASHTYDYNQVIDTCATVAGEIRRPVIIFTDGVDMDNWANNEVAIVRVRRKHDDASDNMSGDMELWGLEVVERPTWTGDIFGYYFASGTGASNRPRIVDHATHGVTIFNQMIATGGGVVAQVEELEALGCQSFLEWHYGFGGRNEAGYYTAMTPLIARTDLWPTIKWISFMDESDVSGDPPSLVSIFQNMYTWTKANFPSIPVLAILGRPWYGYGPSLAAADQCDAVGFQVYYFGPAGTNEPDPGGEVLGPDGKLRSGDQRIRDAIVNSRATIGPTRTLVPVIQIVPVPTPGGPTDHTQPTAAQIIHMGLVALAADAGNPIALGMWQGDGTSWDVQAGQDVKTALPTITAALRG